MKSIAWLGTTHKDWKALPDDVQDVMGYALHLAQMGETAAQAKPLKGFTGATVFEIVDDCKGDTFRAIYTVQFQEVIYVLHAFQKKSKKGIATPKSDMELIRRRLKQAQEHYNESYRN